MSCKFQDVFFSFKNTARLNWGVKAVSCGGESSYQESDIFDPDSRVNAVVIPMLEYSNDDDFKASLYSMDSQPDLSVATLYVDSVNKKYGMMGR